MINARAAAMRRRQRVLLLTVVAGGLVSFGVCAASLPRSSYPMGEALAGAVLLVYALIMLWNPDSAELGRIGRLGQSALLTAAGVALLWYALSQTSLRVWSDDPREAKRQVAWAKANPVRSFFASRTLNEVKQRLSELRLRMESEEGERLGTDPYARYRSPVGNSGLIGNWIPFGYWSGDWSPVLEGLQSGNRREAAAAASVARKVIVVEGDSTLGKMLKEALASAEQRQLEERRRLGEEAG